MAAAACTAGQAPAVSSLPFASGPDVSVQTSQTPLAQPAACTGTFVAHTLEHTYMFVRYELVLAELRRMGITGVTAQGLPGILGRDGWLARSAWTRGTFLSCIPGLTTAIRLDVHFWWNVGEAVLLLVAAHTYLRATLPASDAAPIGSRSSRRPTPIAGPVDA